jgi:hypothetical protein
MDTVRTVPIFSQPRSDETVWRRTRDGWEPAGWLTPPVRAHKPALHPVVVGLLELLLAVTALVAGSRSAASSRHSSEQSTATDLPQFPRRRRA